MYDPNEFDDFDSQIQPEEIQDDNPIDEDYEPYGDEPEEYVEDAVDDFYTSDIFGHGPEYDEGSDRDNWEAEQVFQDHEC